MEVTVIKGNVFNDSRGSVSFVNDFSFSDIKRFYIIENAIDQPIRAWHGHKLDCKNFYCVTGSFQIAFVEVDDWDNPSADLQVASVILTAGESQVLKIPAGYANAIKTLEAGSKLLSFSTLPLNQIADDDVRFEADTWSIND